MIGNIYNMSHQSPKQISVLIYKCLEEKWPEGNWTVPQDGLSDRLLLASNDLDNIHKILSRCLLIKNLDDNLLSDIQRYMRNEN